MKRRHWLFLLAILTLAVVLRVIALTTREIQYDDAFSVFLAQRPLGDIIAGTAADTMPPLYYFLLHFWMAAFGSGLAVLRLLSVLLSLLALLVFFDLGRRMFGIEAGLWIALLIAISPIQIYHAQDMRMYALLELTQGFYFWCFIGLSDKLISNRRRVALWVGLILAGAASMYTHNLAVFGLLIADAYLLVQRRWKDLLRLLAAQAAILLLALPWLLLVPAQIAKVQRAFWTPRPGLVEIFQAVMMFSVNLPLEGALMIIAAVLSVQILVIVVIETMRGWRESPGVRLLALILLLLPGTLFAISYLMRPVFVPRGFLISSLAYSALAGWIISRPGRRGIGVILAVTVIAAAAVSLLSFYTYKAFPRSAFREAAAYLGAVDREDVLILHDNKLSYFPVHYYAPDLAQKFLADEPGSANDTYAFASQQAIGLFPEPDVSMAAAGVDTVYFVVFQQAVDEYLALGEENHPVMSWLENEYRLAGVKSFTDLDVYEFER